MASGRTPTMTIAASGVGTVTLEDITTPVPFPSVRIQRKYQDRFTRDSDSGPAKLKRIFRKFSEADLEIPVSIRYCTAAQYLLLRQFAALDVPEVTVSYLYLSGIKFDLLDLDPIPDDFWWDVEQTYQVSFVLKGKTSE